MAVTVTKRGVNGRRYVVADVLLDAAYPVGGYVLKPDDFGLAVFDHMLPGPALAGGNLLIAAFDPSSGKLRLFYPTGGSAAAPAAVAQPVTTVAVANGATPVTSTASQPDLTETTTPGAGKEVLAETDLSAFTVRVAAFGA